MCFYLPLIRNNHGGCEAAQAGCGMVLGKRPRAALPASTPVSPVLHHFSAGIADCVIWMLLIYLHVF